MTKVAALPELDFSAAEGTSEKLKIAAVYLFAARGYHGTSIRDIARLIGVTNAGVYHFFESKEALLVEIITEGQELLARVSRKLLAEVDEPEDKIARMVGTLVGAHGKNRALSFVTDWEIRSLEVGSTSHELIRTMRKDYEALWESIIIEGIEKGRFRVDNPRITRLALLNMCTGVSAWYRPDGPSPLPEVVDELVDHALSILRANRDGVALTTSDVRTVGLESMPSSPLEPRLKGTHHD